MAPPIDPRRRTAVSLALAGALLLGACSSSTGDGVATGDPDQEVRSPAPVDGGSIGDAPRAPDPVTSEPSTDAGDDAAPPAPADPTLPSIEVVDVRTGGSIDLASLSSDGPTLLWFWAPHCTRCRAEAPEVEGLATGDAGDLSVVGLGAKDDLAQGQDFISDTGVTFPMVWDADGALWRQFGITAQPAAVLLDRQGEPVDRWQGRIDPVAVAGALAGL